MLVACVLPGIATRTAGETASEPTGCLGAAGPAESADGPVDGPFLAWRQGNRRPSTSVAFPWRSPLDVARVAGMSCVQTQPPPRPDIPCAPPALVTCQPGAPGAWYVRLASPPAPRRLGAAGRSNLYFRDSGLAGMVVWLDSSTEIESWRKTIAGLPGVKTEEPADPDEAAPSHDTRYWVEGVRFEVFASSVMLGGFVEVTAGLDDPLPATEPQLVESSRVPPHYTEIARVAHLEGTVLVKVVVDERGAVTAAKVLEGLPLGLDAEALAAVRQWRFVPAERAGMPAPGMQIVRVPFRLPAPKRGHSVS